MLDFEHHDVPTRGSFLFNALSQAAAFYGADGVKWTRHGLRFETSGYNANR